MSYIFCKELAGVAVGRNFRGYVKPDDPLKLITRKHSSISARESSKLTTTSASSSENYGGKKINLFRKRQQTLSDEEGSRETVRPQKWVKRKVSYLHETLGKKGSIQGKQKTGDVSEIKTRTPRKAITKLPLYKQLKSIQEIPTAEESTDEYDEELMPSMDQTEEYSTSVTGRDAKSLTDFIRKARSEITSDTRLPLKVLRKTYSTPDKTKAREYPKRELQAEVKVPSKKWRKSFQQVASTEDSTDKYEEERPVDSLTEYSSTISGSDSAEDSSKDFIRKSRSRITRDSRFPLEEFRKTDSARDKTRSREYSKGELQADVKVPSKKSRKSFQQVSSSEDSTDEYEEERSAESVTEYSSTISDTDLTKESSKDPMKWMTYSDETLSSEQYEDEYAEEPKLPSDTVGPSSLISEEGLIEEPPEDSTESVEHLDEISSTAESDDQYEEYSSSLELVKPSSSVLEDLVEESPKDRTEVPSSSEYLDVASPSTEEMETYFPSSSSADKVEWQSLSSSKEHLTEESFSDEIEVPSSSKHSVTSPSTEETEAYLPSSSSTDKVESKTSSSSKEHLTEESSKDMYKIESTEKYQNGPTPSMKEVLGELSSSILGDLTEKSWKDSRKEILPKKESTIIEIPEDKDDIPIVEFQAGKVKSYRKRGKGFGKCFTRFCPLLAKLLFSKRSEYRGIKAMLGFPIGVLFGYALHKLVLERLQLSPFTNLTLGSILALCMGIGYALSTQVRCICFLTLPNICGKAGRAYCSTFVVTFLITGPIANILSNGRESMRVMGCIASLNLNHTVQRFKLMFKPVKEIVWDFVGAGEKIKKGTDGVEGAFKEIDKEVNDEEETKMEIAETEELDKEIDHESRVDTVKKKFSGMRHKFGLDSESKYGMKSEFRCESIFTRGVKGCYKSFGAAHDRCHSYLPIIGYLLCWPMKLKFICDLASSFLGRRTCDSNNAMSPGFGESMQTAEGVQSEFDKAFSVKVQYKLDIPPEKVDQITPQDISASVKHQFEKRKQRLEFFLSMINRVMVFLFLNVFNSSRKYCDQYLRKIDYDNKYITSYFRHIDARRRKQGKKTLLPLKKGERLEISEPFKVKFSSEEKVSMVLNIVRLVGEILTVSIIFAFDWILYEFLMLIQRHAHVTYYQTGVHHIKMTIYGDGFIGNMVRSVLKGFDKKHSVSEITTTEGCLPQPSKLGKDSVAMLYGMFLILFVLMIIDAYALRLRRVICSFFYPKREKKRVLFLYNDRLKKRRSYMEHMKKQVRKMAREQSIALETGVLLSLRHVYPKLFGWLKRLGLGKKKCLICEEVESKKVLYVTHSEDCPFSYCPECWKDTKGRCYVCFADDDEDSPPSDEGQDSEEDKSS